MIIVSPPTHNSMMRHDCNASHARPAIWNPNFFSNVTWEVTQNGRYCYRRELTLDSRGRTNAAIYGSNSASEAKILNGNPPKAHQTLHIWPDATAQWGS